MRNYKPIELKRNMHNKSNYYVTYSLKNRRNVSIFNELEYKNFLMIETNPFIIRYCERPFKINIESSLIKEIIPDIWILYKNGKEEIQQIDYNKKFISNGNSKAKEISKTLEQWCDNNNFIYRLKTDKDIDKHSYYIKNLRFLYGNLKRQNEILIKKYFNTLKSSINSDKLKILDIVSNNIIPLEMVYPSIAYGICNGKLNASIKNSIINFNTEIWSNYEKKY